MRSSISDKERQNDSQKDWFRNKKLKIIFKKETHVILWFKWRNTLVTFKDMIIEEEVTRATDEDTVSCLES